MIRERLFSDASGGFAKTESSGDSPDRNPYYQCRRRLIYSFFKLPLPFNFGDGDID